MALATPPTGAAGRGAEFGAHLPLIDISGAGVADLAGLQEYARVAAALGYRYLSANDHMVFSRPCSEDLTLPTSIRLPAVRGPVPLADDLHQLERFAAEVAPNVAAVR